MLNNWPKSSVDIKKLGTDPSNQITVLNSGVLENDFYRYANHFYEAGDEIIKDAISSGDIAKLDSCYFALVYLYRQSIELMLKAIIFTYIKSDTDRINMLRMVRHDVFSAFNVLISEAGINISNDNMKWLSDFLEDISRIDRESDMFRYPFSSDMKVLFDKQTHVSLEAIYYNFYRAFDMLDEFYKTKSFTNKKYDNEYDPKLIIEGGDYYSQSVIGYTSKPKDYTPYYDSYDSCGDILKEVIKNEGKKHLFMPMCYLYRNAIELGLKRIIVEDSHLDDDKKYKVLKKKKHSILGLWNSIKDEISLHKPDSSDTTLDDVLLYIDAFHNIDNSSSLFRYPCDKDLNVFFSSNQEFDLENVVECFKDLLSFFDSVSYMMSEVLEYENEMSYYMGY